MKPDVFISYSHADEQKALAIGGFLKRQGLRCWIDRSGLKLADGFDKKITKAINDSCVVLWLVSNESLESDYVRYELSTAVSREKAIGPIFLERLDRSRLKPPFDFAETRVHGIEYFKGSVEENLATLLEDLRPLIRPRKMKRLGFMAALILAAIVAAAVAFFPKSPPALPKDVAALPAANALKVAYGSSPPAPPTGFALPKLQFGIAARRQGELGFIPLADGESLTSMRDTYVVLARPQSPGYLYVFQVDSLGKSEWLFPQNQSSPYSSGSNPVAPEQIIQIPPAESGRELYLDDTAGFEHIYAVLSATRWPALEEALSRQSRASPPAEIERVQKPNGLRTRGVGGARITTVPATEAQTFVVERPTSGKVYSLPLRAEIFETSGPALTVERWFRHIEPR
jgi:hypothetical protein